MDHYSPQIFFIYMISLCHKIDKNRRAIYHNLFKRSFLKKEQKVRFANPFQDFCSGLVYANIRMRGGEY